MEKAIQKENTLWQKIVLWVHVVRPHTLFAALAPVLVGLMVAGMLLKSETTRATAEQALREAQLQKALATNDSALLQGLNVLITDDTVELLQTGTPVPHFKWGLAVVTLLCALALQIFANLVNDYYDFRRGADQKGRVGFGRSLAEGLVELPQMRRAILVTLAFVVLFGFILIRHGGWPILLIGLASILFAWMYTATRYSLAYLGVADVFVFIFFGVVATAGTTLLQTDGWSWRSVAAGGVCGAISVCVLCINNLRDRHGDAQVGKRTLVVRWGKHAGLTELALCVVATPVCAALAFGLSWPCLIVLPMAGLFFETLHAEGAAYNRCLVHAGLCNMIFVLLVLITMLVRMAA